MESKHGLFRLSVIKGRFASTQRFSTHAECFRILRKLQRKGPYVIGTVEVRTLDGWIDSGTEL
jgi:hypothetical protein